jgi:hypothetical protein
MWNVDLKITKNDSNIQRSGGEETAWKWEPVGDRRMKEDG